MFGEMGCPLFMPWFPTHTLTHLPHPAPAQRFRQRKFEEQQREAVQLSGRVDEAVEGMGGWVSMGELRDAGALEDALGEWMRLT